MFSELVAGACQQADEGGSSDGGASSEGGGGRWVQGGRACMALGLWVCQPPVWQVHAQK